MLFRSTLLPGDVLMDQGEFNERLYYVHSGQLIATVSAPDDVGEEEQAELFLASRSEERRAGKEGRSRWSPYH